MRGSRPTSLCMRAWLIKGDGSGPSTAIGWSRGERSARAAGRTPIFWRRRTRGTRSRPARKDGRLRQQVIHGSSPPLQAAPAVAPSAPTPSTRRRPGDCACSTACRRGFPPGVYCRAGTHASSGSSRVQGETTSLYGRTSSFSSTPAPSSACVQSSTTDAGMRTPGPHLTPVSHSATSSAFSE